MSLWVYEGVHDMEMENETEKEWGRCRQGVCVYDGLCVCVHLCKERQVSEERKYGSVNQAYSERGMEGGGRRERERDAESDRERGGLCALLRVIFSTARPEERDSS